MSNFQWHSVHNLHDLKIFYKQVIPKIRKAARRHGYAIGVHGSMVRDLDLIAVPWKENHSSPDQVAKAIQFAACGLRQKKYKWEKKPCGRIATMFPICWEEFNAVHGTGHIDLSLTPTKQERVMSLTNTEQYLTDYVEHAAAPVRQYISALESEIQRLRERHKELEEETRWIPVSERLPEEEGIYLCWFMFDGKGYATTAQFYNGLFRNSDSLKITHWKPITPP